ncbi:MAG TPA: DNA repair ATPase, partial [Nocardioidaceae bacterium]|nr:DNA repair ATPase [Nocardioidaceae bacterium]
GGYYLATGVARTFDTETSDLEFERVIRSPNGEDVLYVFHARESGRTLLLPYNVIRKEVATPLPCHGYSLFEDGTLVAFRATSEEPTRVHPMQVWQTPYLADSFAAAQPVGTGPLERVGNADLVRGISDCLSVTRMVDEMAPSTAVFEGLIAACARVFDNYHWLGEPEFGDLRTPVTDVRATAEQVLAEYENVQSLTETAAGELAAAGDEIASLVRRVRGEAPKSADQWVEQLASLRRAQGRLVSLRELRYVDAARIDELAQSLSTELDAAAKRAVEFLRGPDAFAGYHERVESLVADASAIRTVAEAEPVGERLAEQAGGLEVVTEVVGSLDIADATVRTRILERIGEVLGGVNRARATLDARRRELLSTEGRAAFAAEFALLGQAITGALAVADTPQRCDEQLGRLLLSLENLESRFAEFDDFLTELAAKRTDVYEAFSSRKQALVDEQARRADRLVDSAQRILASINRRVASLSSLDEINTYFASDPMVAKVRSVGDELRALDDSVRAEELAGRLKAARQEAGRTLRDRTDLYSDGGETVRLGRHSFAVNTQAIDVTLVPKDGRMSLAVTGTDFREPVTDPEFEATRPFWDQLLVSESADVYRGEHLAAAVLADGVAPDADLLDVVRRAAESRYDEGYERGVHDHDAAAILTVLVRLHAAAGLLRYPPQARAAGQLFWAFGVDEPTRALWSTRAGSLARARSSFGEVPAIRDLCGELAAAMSAFALPPSDPGLAAEYLFEELASSPAGFVTSAGAKAIVERFRRRKDLEEDLRALGSDLVARHQLAHAWLAAFVATSDGLAATDLPEAVALLLADVPRRDSSATLSSTVEGLLGAHPRIVDRRLEVRLDELLTRTRRFRESRVPAFRAYQKLRNDLVARSRTRLRLDEFRPKVMSAFVRNRLLDEVYLPLIGDNLAKQLGAVGDAKRTDQMGLLLLISPPGYGKTTLMEYVANRLGLVFVKVNGPALGHEVTSLDPAEAP